MKITFLLTGKTDVPWVKQGTTLYESRLKHYVKFEAFEIPELKSVSGMSVNQIKEREGELILKYIKEGDEVVLLDERGKMLSSEEFADFINKKGVKGTKNLVFVVVGAYGFSDEVYKRANDKLSMSAMTFSHQMIRVIFTEQLYRAYTIIKGEPYHHR